MWSSRWSVKVAAFSTFVSFSKEILQQQQGQTLSFSGLPHTLPSSRRSRMQDAGSALRHALRHHKLLIAIRRIHRGSRTACGGLH